MFRTFTVMLSLTAFLLLGGEALSQNDAAPASNWDGARLFSSEAKLAAEQKMKQIEVKFSTRLEFETLEKLTVEGKDAVAVNRFLNTWALDRFRQKGQRGIYVLIVKDPAKIRVVHSNALETK